ncbi:uncharacterized protein LOC134283118 [Saccostrea cucullata]|uniref:uncharacterized protein LOC134283118 n=1 Tax=Saccostrea cuccullata TaxID=36930 RepID=UPI002ED44F75
MNNKNMKMPQKPQITIERSTSLRNYAYRRPDANTEEFVKFITERQPTNLRLQRKVPLPEIGTSGLRDSGFLDKNSDTSDYDDTLLDNEIASVYCNKSKNSRKDLHVQEVLTLTREQTRDNLFNKSLSNGLADHLNGNVLLFRQTTDIRKRGGLNVNLLPKVNRPGKQLPPIEQLHIPDRPTAPSPSRTPPFSNSDGSFIEEEPVDYIDSS